MRANKLDSFFHDIGYRLKIAQNTKKLLDKRLASSFSLFPYIAPNENRISEIIRDLLDPNGNHGQGDIFLQKFIEIIEKPEFYESGDHAFIRIEEHTTSIENNKRRIDILIEIKRNNQHHAGIAIENKPWAIDQNKQLDDYSDHIRQRYPNYYIIYLTPDGREPPEHSAAKTKINDKEAPLSISYKYHITSWLQACQKESQADYVRQFLSDFSNYCHQPNLNHQNMKNTEIESKTIIDYLIENNKNLELALSISNIIQETKKIVISDFFDSLKNQMGIAFPEHEINSNLHNYPSKYTRISLSKPEWGIEIALENEDKFANSFVIGVTIKDGVKTKPQTKTAIFNATKKSYSQSGQFNEHWIYWDWLKTYGSWTNDDVLITINKNHLVVTDYIINQFKQLEDIIKEYPEVLIPCQPAG